MARESIDIINAKITNNFTDPEYLTALNEFEKVLEEHTLRKSVKATVTTTRTVVGARRTHFKKKCKKENNRVSNTISYF